ncbi:MAG: peroxiredoxin family protein [Pseudomonadota bacterium]
MHTNKLHAGSAFPEVKATLLSDETVSLSATAEGCDWKMVVVYRGRHCPLCTKYLNELEQYVQALRDNGVDLVAVSGDSKAQVESHLEKLDISFPIAYGLSQQQMQELGLYISIPRSEKETDHNFAEPGLFVVNQDGNLQVVDISNNPFVRPNLAELVSGLNWIRNPENNYPIRGTFN